MKTVSRFLAPIVVAVVFGPLVAALALCVLSVVSNITDYAGAFDWSGLPGLFTMNIIFTYYEGTAVALVAGILVAIWMISRPPNFLVAIGAAAAATAIYVGVGATGIFGPATEFDAKSNYLFIFIMAVIAAAVCWLIFGRFARRV